MNSNGRWRGGVYVLDGSVVGTIDKTASGNWAAYGCISEWQDTPLALRLTEAHAKKEVEYWVGEHHNDYWEVGV